MKTKIHYLIFSTTLIFSSCEKDYYKPVPAAPAPPSASGGTTTKVSFANDILPIFRDGGCQPCHLNTAPNLSDGTAFAVLTTANASSKCSSVPYINKTNPANSLIYIPNYCPHFPAVTKWGKVLMERLLRSRLIKSLPGSRKVLQIIKTW